MTQPFQVTLLKAQKPLNKKIRISDGVWKDLNRVPKLKKFRAFQESISSLSDVHGVLEKLQSKQGLKYCIVNAEPIGNWVEEKHTRVRILDKTLKRRSIRLLAFDLDGVFVDESVKYDSDLVEIAKKARSQLTEIFQEAECVVHASSNYANPEYLKKKTVRLRLYFLNDKVLTVDNIKRLKASLKPIPGLDTSTLEQNQPIYTAPLLSLMKKGNRCLTR